MDDLQRLAPRSNAFGPYDGKGGILAVVESPRGTRSKYKYDRSSGLFRLSHVLPPGMAFPLDYGFVPGTVAEDGDALDVLVLVEEPPPVGGLLATRLIGLLEAQQTQQGETYRNDRVLAVAKESRDYRDVNTIEDLPEGVLERVEEFFVTYNRMRGRTFQFLRRHEPGVAYGRVEETLATAR